eukprot:TRINITY_DN1545_c0_g1_i1.p1 TRINITY_DN1545_c0_g1~~TRINITY_DN1545_c0_g1_i1.p1  ORF type:complete len:446 (-),score=62.71 TRINITY_DN1545_c0_g1_i1:342-1679(-)
MGGKSSSQYAELGGEEYMRCRVLGKGAFGKVYAVQHVFTGVFRVIKEMHKGTIIAKGSGIVPMLIKEREFLSELKGCPYVVKCFASTQDEKFLYILLEFCSGGELEFHLNQTGKFTERTIRSYLAQLTVALEHMHNKYHIVHRDLKLENVLLDEKGYCAIIDFNMAEKCDDDLIIENPQKFVVGTLPYIAPELLQGKKHSNKVDYWSLGIMAYEMAHGRKPFMAKKGEGSEKRRQLKAITSTELDTLFDVDISDNFKDLLKGLLNVEPKSRFGPKEIKNHKFFKNINWDDVESRNIEVPIIPRDDRVNFTADANVEEVFGMAKPKEVEVSDEQQKEFAAWDWASTDQELPPPNPELVAKYQKKHKNKGSNSSSRKSSLSPEVNIQAMTTPRKDSNSGSANNANHGTPNNHNNSSPSNGGSGKKKLSRKNTKNGDKQEPTKKVTYS